MIFAEPRWTFGLSAGACRGASFLYRFGYVAEVQRKSVSARSMRGRGVPVRPLAPDATAADRATAEVIGDYWTNFAKAGDPNGSGLPVWARLEPRHKALAIGIGARP